MENHYESVRKRFTPRYWGLLAPLAAITVLWAWYGIQPALDTPIPDESNTAEVRLSDFRDALYFPVRELLAGGNPYSPSAMFEHWPVGHNFNFYQPYHLILNAVFALPGYRVGAVAFTLVSLGLLLLLAYMAAWELRARIPLAAGFFGAGALLLVGEVGKGQLYVGQINPLVAVSAAGTLMLRKTHPRWAAIALAVAWVKPQFGFPLAVLLLFRGSWRIACRGTALAALASLPVVVYLVSQGGIARFIAVLKENLNWAEETDYAAVDSMTAHRPDLAGVFFRLTGWAPAGIEIVALVGALVVAGLIARRLDRSSAPGLNAVADLLCLATVVVALVHQPGDILITFPAMAAVLAAFWRPPKDMAWMPVLAVCLLLVPHAHHERIDRVITEVVGSRAALTTDGVAIIAAWLTLVLFGLLSTRRSATSQQVTGGGDDELPSGQAIRQAAT
jgi:hypothetical protein